MSRQREAVSAFSMLPGIASAIINQAFVIKNDLVRRFPTAIDMLEMNTEKNKSKIEAGRKFPQIIATGVQTTDTPP